MAQASDMSNAEWQIMRVVWTVKEATSSEIITAMKQKKDWSESTIKTLLRRLVQKEMLITQKVGRHFIYRPLIAEDDAMIQMTSAVFDRLCSMKKGRTLAELITDMPLSQSDIMNLQEILKQKMTTAPEMIACDCLVPASCVHCAE
ncbi:CopY/TcrY family copper transport repressor [Weissella bombi]|uniref:Copper transport repressor, CopY/TcrY family n=1 Tax=Weissella bombi TaxID=1505725 RepID=A0A1C4BIY1_9LACO|nr:CopY/TcrY family copper transport repressor [Weissella bombi]SCC06825.1 copper transport repressor, CopY/TcrY family [Weissella bombi]